MTTLLMHDIVSLGTLQEPRPNVEFSLQHSTAAWLVLSGSLHLFLVGDELHPAAGARHAVFRVGSSQAVFGVGAGQLPTKLVATATPGTRLLFLDRDNLVRASAESTGPSFAELVDAWVLQLNAALETPLPAVEITSIRDEKPLTLRVGPRALLPEAGVFWVKQRKGRARFGGSTVLPSQVLATHFPVTRTGWLLADRGDTFEASTSAELQQTGQLFASLDLYHAVVLPLLIASRDQRLLSESVRLRGRAQSDRAVTEKALWRLAAPLAPVRAEVYGESTLQHPVFLACQAVGVHLGIRIKPDPDMLRSIAVPDPIFRTARASGIQVRRVALKGMWWKQDSGPLVAFLEESKRAVALLPRSNGRYEIFDPEAGTRTLLGEEEAAGLNPFAFCLYRSFPNHKLAAMDLLRFGLFGCSRELWTMLLMGICAGLLSLITPLLTGIIFDRLIPGAERGQLAQVCLILVVVASVAAMFNLVRSFATLRLEGKLDSALQAAYWDRLLKLPVPFFRTYTSGDLAVRSLAIAQIRQALTGSTITAVLTGIFSFFSFALLFYYSWRLACLATLLVAFAFLVSLLCGYAQMSAQRKVLQLRGVLSGRVLQIIDGLAKFRVSGTELRAFAFWARDFSRQKLLWLKVRKINNVFVVFNSIFPVMSLGAIFFYHAYLTTQPGIPAISTGSFLAFLAAYTQFLTAVLLQSSALMSILGIIPLYDRARPILQTVPEVSEAKATPAQLTGAIEVSHVSFRYRPDSPPVLRDVSLTIRPGEYVAFVGASGSGKSTLLRLLLGFEKPENGAIYFDGQDVDGLDLPALRKQIGVVLQTSRPVAGDIFTNIVGSSPLSLQDAWDAVKLAGMEDDIKQMAMGLHTVVSDGGGGLSGGQRQRLMIARAIVSRPRMLFFDEATSALDNRTQAYVSRSLESFQTTRVVVAHRLSTVMNADQIFVFDKGTIVQSGSYAELMQQEGPFAELAKRQVL